MDLVPLLLDLGNIGFFIATLPQLYKTYKNRHTLKDLSVITFIGFIISMLFFLAVGIMTNAFFTTILCLFNIVNNIVTVHWIRKSQTKTLI